METFHSEHLSDDEMRELNPIIRNAIYTALHAANVQSHDGNAKAWVDSQLIHIPPYWEEPELLSAYRRSLITGDPAAAAERSGSPLWQEQCRAAKRLKEGLGMTTALDYLIGEKLLGFVRLVHPDSPSRADLPAFVAGIREIFSDDELRSYIATLRTASPGDLESRSFDATDREFIEQLPKLLFGSAGSNTKSPRR